MTKVLVLLFVIASTPAHAERRLGRVGALLGVQQTDRSAWVFGPSLEVAISDQLSIRGEVHLELGDLDDPFGDSNLRGGDGPHVNHVMFGPTWRPARYAPYALAVGAEGGVMVMHSVFYSGHEFTKKPAVGLFVQAGRNLGAVSFALQLRVDFSATIEMAGPDGDDVPTTCARLNLAFEIPIDIH